MISPDERRSHDLTRMKSLATALFAAATVMFALATALEHRYGWLGYVRATAEAAMVGAVADWFAVTALFRHPLGLPIPHTAIIPTRKDDIGRGLGAFVQTNFLTAEVVEEKLRDTPIAGRLGTWLADPANAAQVGRQVATVATSVVDGLRDADVQEAIETAVAAQVRATAVGPLVGRGLDLAMADGRHQQVLTVALRKGAEALEANRTSLRDRLAHESPWWVPGTIDDRIFTKVFDGVRALLLDVAADPDHELRHTFDERIGAVADELVSSPEMQARVDELKEELITHPAMQEWSASVWRDLKQALAERAADPSSELNHRIEAAVVGLGERLRDDAGFRHKADDWARSVVGRLVEQSQAEVGDFIASTVARWDADESSRRIELAVGRDLQFIRINGTVVGGLVGLLIYSVGQLLH